MKPAFLLLPIFFAVASVGACKNTSDGGTGGADAVGSGGGAPATSGGAGGAASCYEPTPASGEDAFVARDGANTHTFLFTLPDDPEGGLVTITLTGRQIFSGVRVSDVDGDAFFILNALAPDDVSQATSGSFVGAPGVTYAVDVEESWVTATDREATVELSWELQPTRDCFEPNDTPGEASPIALEAEVEAFLFAGYSKNEWPTYEEHHDFYAVDVQAPGTLKATLQPGADAVSLALYASGSTDAPLTDGFTIDDTAIELAVDVEPGSYLLRVEPFVSPIYNSFDGEITSWNQTYTLRASLE